MWARPLAYPRVEASERFFIRVGSGLTHKQKTRQERPARDKHTSLFKKVATYGRKSFISLTLSANVIKLFTAVSYDFS
jgi:hypothetical protein